ncbi:MAG: hypothetical protein GXY60_12750 [Spirochaetales bacterium]|nr:hypothetical protein [Spirochaetales bacterium]
MLDGISVAKTKQEGLNAIYANNEACHQCVNRCPASKQHKTVRFSADTQIVPVRL